MSSEEDRETQYRRVLEIAQARNERYPYDLPGMIERTLPQERIKLLVTHDNVRDYPILVDCDESGLIAIHQGIFTDPGYTITHPPSGVAYLQGLESLFEAVDFANFLASNLDRIEKLELDYTQLGPGKPGSCQIVNDPGDVNGLIREWLKMKEEQQLDVHLTRQRKNAEGQD